jgi:hypothetical protein
VSRRTGGYHLRMRRLAVYLSVIGLVAVAVAVGWIASDWPHWCRVLHWCDGQGLF